MSWEPAAPCLVCPLCSTSLKHAGSALKCAGSHSFDLAGAGYVNLLLTHRTTSRPPGDSREMLLARRRFLERGHYRCLSDAINELACRHLGDRARHAGKSGDVCILDIGCGEGYYLGRLRQQLASRPGHGGIWYFGMDVARDAARLAARRYPSACFVVADINTRLPFADASIHLLLNIFAPRNPGEFARILASGGLLVVVIPTPNHLRELRAALPLLHVEEDKRRRVIERFSGLLTLMDTTTLEYEIALRNAEIRDLVRMTPSNWHLTPGAIEAMQRIEGIRTTVGFSILGFRKLPESATGSRHPTVMRTCDR